MENAVGKIVIADDDTELAAVIAQRLGNEKFECIIASDGEEAFHITKRELPDVMILDIMLPKLSGYEVCRRMQRDPQLYTVPVLVLTGLSDEPEILHALEQGADDVVTKPFRFDNLIQKVRGLLAMKRSLNEPHPIFGLVGTDAIKRHINHRLARDDQLAVCYIDILHSKAFRSVHGADRYTQVVKLGADTLRETREGLEFYDSFIGYMGGQDFIAVMNIEQHEPYCKTILSSFEQRVTSFYRPVECKQGYIIYNDGKGRESKAPLMKLSIGVVHNEERKFHSARRIFEILTQLKSKIKEDAQGGLFVDRRCHAR